MPAFAGRTRTVVDNRDIGRSEYVEDAYEISDMAAHTLALADHLGLEHFPPARRLDGRDDLAGGGAGRNPSASAP